jgi:hypothetical protein
VREWLAGGSVLQWARSPGNLNLRYSNVEGKTMLLLAEASANVGTSSFSRLQEIPTYGQSWSGFNSTKTLGILEIPGRGDIYLQSGEVGPVQLISKGTSGFDALFRLHVEEHAAAIMRLEGLSEANLYINYPSDPWASCLINLPRTLPAGTRLDIISPAGSVRFP